MADLDVRVVDKAALRSLQRLERELPGAIIKGTHRAALFTGRQVALDIEGGKKYKPGTRRLARSYLVPVEQGIGKWLLGAGAPVYAGIQNFGGTITAKKARKRGKAQGILGVQKYSGPMLIFQVPPKSGRWRSAKSVTIKPKHFVQHGIAKAELEAPRIVEVEIVRIIRAVS